MTNCEEHLFHQESSNDPQIHQIILWVDLFRYFGRVCIDELFV
jgi:hypothetical protein